MDDEVLGHKSKLPGGPGNQDQKSKALAQPTSCYSRVPYLLSPVSRWAPLRSLLSREDSTSV